MSTTRKPQSFAIGDRVAFAVNFLRSIGETRGEMPQRRGTIERIADPIAYVRWDGFPPLTEPGEPGCGGVNVANLTLVSRIAIDSALATVPVRGFEPLVKGL